MATYVNDLRLKEIATGDESGTWGTSTNTNLELIAEAFSFGTEAITTNADTHTTTIADGATDPGRSIFLKYTGTLDSACTITIGPNTVSKLWFIENATSGSQNIIIKQGSGATVTIPAGDTKAIYSDGAGSGGAMVDAFASLNVVDLKVEDDLTVTDDLIVNGDIDLEGSIDVNGTANLDVVDIDGAVDMASTLQVDGAITSDAGAIISVTDNSDVLTLRSTDADANAGPILNLNRNSASPADNDYIGEIKFDGRNDAAQAVTYAGFAGRILDASDGTEDGRFELYTIRAGAQNSMMVTTADEIVFNNDSIDIDFRVETNTNANALFVDSATNCVIVGSQIAENRVAQQFAVTTAGARGGMCINSFFASASGPILDFQVSRHNTAGSHTVVQDGDALGTLIFRGDDGDEFKDGAAIEANVDGTPGNNDMPTLLRFFTTPDSSGLQERMRLDSTGDLAVGTTSAAAEAKIHVEVATSNPNAGSPTDSSALMVNGGTTTEGNGPVLALRNISGSKETIARMTAETTSSNNGDLTFSIYGGGSTIDERLRLTSTGHALVGTTSNLGSISNSSRVTGGIFNTFADVVGAANNTATTMVNLSSAFAVYIVSAGFNGVGNTNLYGATAIIHADGTSFTMTQLVNPSNMTLSMSGSNVQATQTSGATLNISFACIRIQ